MLSKIEAPGKIILAMQTSKYFADNVCVGVFQESQFRLNLLKVQRHLL